MFDSSSIDEKYIYMGTRIWLSEKLRGAEVLGIGN